MKHTPTYAEVLVRDPRTLEVVPDGDVGLLEFVCPLPTATPALPCSWTTWAASLPRPADGELGTAFEVVGRAERAETRGCGDTLPELKYEIRNSNKENKE